MDTKFHYQLNNSLKKLLSILVIVAVSLREYFRPFLSNNLGASHEELRGYWIAYGGWRAILGSHALWFSIIFAVICYPSGGPDRWTDVAISIVPNLMGFTLGAMAIVLAFPGSRFFKIFAEGGNTKSYYLDLASKFVHFIFVQALAILFGILSKAYPYKLIGFIGFTLLIYAVSCAAMTALALFGVAQIFNHPGISEADDDENNS